jgi:release factor glutamine methyltransferase
LSADALQLARENAVGHGVADRIAFALGDLLPARAQPRYAVICANLPYVATGDLAGLAAELSFEPRAALDGGPDGLDVVRRLLDQLPGTLAADGVALLEIGADQAEGIERETAARLPGWRCTVTADLAGLPRLARIDRPDAGVTSTAAGVTSTDAAVTTPDAAVSTPDAGAGPGAAGADA